MLFKPGQFYALAALGGCLLFVLLTVNLGMPAPRAAIITIAGTFVVRALAIQFNWGTKSLYRPDVPAWISAGRKQKNENRSRISGNAGEHGSHRMHAPVPTNTERGSFLVEIIRRHNRSVSARGVSVECVLFLIDSQYHT